MSMEDIGMLADSKMTRKDYETVWILYRKRKEDFVLHQSEYFWKTQQTIAHNSEPASLSNAWD